MENTFEQNQIIYSKEKYISVLATAGSGKTSTLVKRVEQIKTNKKILIISFTNAAVDEIKSRFKIKKDNLEIRNFDSFFLDLFKKYQHLFSNKFINFDELSFVKKSFVSDLAVWEEELWDKKRLHFTNQIFKKKIINEILGSSNNSIKIKNVLSSMYSDIIIDEAQDMDRWQLELLKIIKTHTNISITILGDENQSMYGFRGAIPEELIKFIEENKFSKFELTKSFRCPEDIYKIRSSFKIKNKKYFNSIEDVKNVLNTKTENYHFHEFAIDNFLSNEQVMQGTLESSGINLNEETTIIVQRNLLIDKIKSNNKFSDFKNLNSPFEDDNNYGYSKIAQIYFSNNYPYFISEYNFDESEKLYRIYKDITFKKFFSNSKKNVENFKLFVLHVLKEYQNIDLIENKFSIENDMNFIEDNYEKIKKWAIESDQNIITMRTSKGLEFDNIILILESWMIRKSIEDNKKEIIQNIFVSLTRAKKKLLVIWS